MSLDLSFLNDLPVKVTPGALLKDVTTFRLGGPCQALIECAAPEDLTETVRRLKAKNIDFLMMGFGSNILASDEGVERVIVRYSSPVPRIRRSGNTLTADASTELDQLVLYAIQEGLDGLLLFSGIPGTVGGGIAGNAGAYGAAISDPLSELTLLKKDGQVVTVPKSAIHFDYRDSDIKHNGDVVLSAVFTLTPGKDPDAMLRSHDNMVAERHKKHGDWKLVPSAGSFFKNVLRSSHAGKREAAGWFLDESGAKMLNVNGAHTHPNHANIVTRDEGAAAQDVYALTRQMRDLVQKKFGIELVREVRLLGKFPDAPESDAKGFW